jgi:GDP-D-mannose dehydratase
MIAQHILYNNEIQKYNVYGFGHSDKSSSKNITKFNFDMNSDLLKHYTEIVKPDSIIHLAAISSSQIAFENPFDAIQTNG